MDTRNATSEEEILPGQEFQDRKGRGLADFVSSRGGSARIAERWIIRRTESTGSTNDDLMRAAQGGAPDRLILVADHQTAGRGRLDRRWEAPPGANLLVSILFRNVPDLPHRLTQAVALAAVAACRSLATRAADVSDEFDVSLKWPNDIVIGHRKLAGILASASTARRSSETEESGFSVPEFVVVGLGLNVQWAPDDAVRLAEFVAEVDRDEVLAGFIIGLDEILDADPVDAHDRYRSELSTIGRAVRVELPSGDVLQGRALGVGEDGRLEVLDACAVTHHVDVADIVHLRFDDGESST